MVHETFVKRVDLRRHQRILVPEGVGIRVAGRAGGPALEGIATVIGLGGMFCRSKDKQPPGTVITLHFTCPAVTFELECTVRHVNEQGMGIEFTDFTPENRQRLEALLLQLQA